MLSDQRRHFRIAQAVLLIQEAGMAAGLLVVPGAPFVHIKPDLLVRIILVHDGGGLGHDLVDVQAHASRVEAHSLSGKPVAGPLSRKMRGTV